MGKRRVCNYCTGDGKAVRISCQPQKIKVGYTASGATSLLKGTGGISAAFY